MICDLSFYVFLDIELHLGFTVGTVSSTPGGLNTLNRPQRRFHKHTKMKRHTRTYTVKTSAHFECMHTQTLWNKDAWQWVHDKKIRWLHKHAEVEREDGGEVMRKGGWGDEEGREVGKWNGKRGKEKISSSAGQERGDNQVSKWLPVQHKYHW